MNVTLRGGPWRRSTLVALILLATACSREVSTAPEGDPLLASSEDAAFTLPSDSFVFQSSAGWVRGQIPFRFTNRSDRTISLLNCNGGYGRWLERKEGDSWKRAWSGVRLGCLSPPVRIAPGEQLVDTLRVVAAPYGSNSYPQFSTSDPGGTYRLVIGSAYWEYDHDGPPWGVEVPSELRTSGSFELRIQR